MIYIRFGNLKKIPHFITFVPAYNSMDILHVGKFRFLLSLTLLASFYAAVQAQSSRMEIMAKEGYSYRFTDTLKSKTLLNNALSMAVKSGSKPDEAICLSFMALTYRRLHHIKAYSSYAEQAYKIASQTKDERARAYGFMAMGSLKGYFENKPESLDYRLKAYSLFGKLKEYGQFAQIAAEISYLFSSGTDEKVEKYARESMKYAEQSADAESILFARLAMGSYLSGLSYKKPQDLQLWKNTVGFLQLTSAFASREQKQISSKSNIAIAHINLAAMYIRKPKLMDEQAFMNELDTAIGLSKKYGIKNIYGNSIGLQGQYFMQNRAYEKAENLFLEGISYQLQLPYRDNEILASFYTSLKEIAAARKDFKSYYNYDQLFSNYNRLTYDENLHNNLQNAEIKFESAKKMLRIRQLESERKLQEQNKNLSYAISAGLLLILVFIYISFYYRKRYFQQQEDHLKQQHLNNELKLNLLEKDSLENLLAKLSVERKFLQSQMDPHFIFNALGNIQSIILQGDKTKAILYLNKFARLTRQTLDHSRKESVSLEDEIESLKNYIELQQLRLNSSFDYEFDVAPEIRKQEKIPPLFIQPLVENAIEHGLKPLADRRGKLMLHFEMKPSEKILVCTVADNGIGTAAARKNEKDRSHQSLATNIIDERIALYHEKDKAGFISSLQRESSEKGCTVIIHIPIV